MKSTEFFKNKVKKFAKQTWAGPGKFGVFIVLCVIVIASFESLGLSYREENLKLRTVPNIVIPDSEKVTINIKQDQNEAVLYEKIKLSAKIDFQKKILERENILLNGAVDQYLFEHQNYLKNYKSDFTLDERTKLFVSLILKKTEEIETTNSDEILIFDI